MKTQEAKSLSKIVSLDLPYSSESELDWLDNALCSQVDHDIFFPEKGGSTKTAKSVCGVCGVREKCLKYSLENEERYGIWGGMSDRERRAKRAG
jgi:WhiB family redox-sensing transcriptional regulator